MVLFRMAVAIYLIQSTAFRYLDYYIGVASL
jgi:hypothetical protein